MVKIKPFELSQVENVEWLHPEETAQTDLNYWKDSKEVAIRSIYADETFLGVAGVKLMRYGVGELFLLPAKAITSHHLSICKAALSLILHAKEVLSLHRVQMTVEEGRHDLECWAWFLGFEAEGLLKSYCVLKKNHWMYGRVF